MVAVPANFALYAVGAGLLLALIVMGVGAWPMIARARALQMRIEDYQDLPIFKAIELAQARIEIGSAAAAKIPDLMTRLQRALDEVRAARTTLTYAAAVTRDTVRYFFGR